MHPDQAALRAGHGGMSQPFAGAGAVFLAARRALAQEQRREG
jgi:hypothetical protein